MRRNFAAERKRVRDEYESLIDECRASMDKSWKKKQAKYVPVTDAPFEDIRVSGLRFNALFEDVAERNQRIEKLRHEMDCKLNKINDAQDCAQGDAIILGANGEKKQRPSSTQTLSPVSPSHVERHKLFTPDEADHGEVPQLLTPPTSPVATAAETVSATTQTPTQPRPPDADAPQAEYSPRPVLEIRHLFEM